MMPFKPSEEETEFFMLVVHLTTEVMTVKIHTDDPESGVSRSHYVRSVFAFIEGVTWAMKQFAASQLSSDQLTEGEALLLRDGKFQLSDAGKVEESLNYLRLAPNLRFAFRLFARGYGVTYELPTSGTGWCKMIEAIQIRNRLTHPRRSEEMEVSNAEYRSVESAFEWFQSRFHHVHHEAIKLLLPEGKRSEEDLDRFLKKIGMKG